MKKVYLLTLHCLAAQDLTNRIGDQFGVSSYTVVKMSNIVMEIVYEKRETFVYWSNAAKRASIGQKLFISKPIVGMVGAVDGSHILIATPADPA